MRPLYIALLIITSICFLRCVTHHKTAYVIPADYPQERRKELTDILEKGQKLYKINCSECHGIFTKGKDNIPNFSTTQLDNYSARFLRKDPKVHAVLVNMSQDQMSQVMTFLRFKKTTKVDSSALKTGS